MDGWKDRQADRQTMLDIQAMWYIGVSTDYSFVKNCEVDIFSRVNIFQTVINTAHFFPTLSLQTDFIT